jgi:hypothetical protein
MEGPVVEDTGERIPPRALGQLAGDALDVGDHAAVEGATRLALAVAVEDAAEDEELPRDLPGRQAEALPLAGMVLRQLAGILVAVQARDEGGERPELSEPAQALERGDDAVCERLLDALDREVPCGCPHDPSHAAQAKGRFG